MSDLRQDALFGRWVIIAEGRAARPIEFPQGERETISAESRCPFCVGHEDDTPPEISRFPQGYSGPNDWKVRVVPNKYPAVAEANGPPTESPFFRKQQAFGAHEVIVESPEHVVSPSQLDDEHLRWVWFAYRERMRALGEQGFPFVQLFKNVGASGGASIEHIHSQILALAHPPDGVQTQRQAFCNYYNQHRRCGLCDMLEQELAQETRVIFQTDQLVAFCPFASRLPYEVWVMPRAHQTNFEDLDDASLSEVGRLVKRILVQFDERLNRPAFNYLIHSSPFDSTTHHHYHWHMEIFPRMTTKAGFEWASGCFVNPVTPEVAALRLRS